MQNAFIKAEELATHLREYINNRIAAVKLQVAERTSKVMSNIIAMSVVAALMLVFTIFMSMGAAYAISDWIGKTYAGFLVVGTAWLIIALAIWLARERLLRIPIMNRMLQEMFNHEEDS